MSFAVKFQFHGHSHLPRGKVTEYVLPIKEEAGDVTKHFLFSLVSLWLGIDTYVNITSWVKQKKNFSVRNIHPLSGCGI